MSEFDFEVVEAGDGSGPIIQCRPKAPARPTSFTLVLPPVRACCFHRHDGVVCPDGKIMCCLCFERFKPDATTTEDVCPECFLRERRA